MENVNFTAIDFETAYGYKNACALGLVIVRNGRIVEEKEFLIQPPGNEISEYCQEMIHGISPSMTKNAPTFGELWPNIKQYFERQVIVYHGDGFDESILRQEFKFYNIVPCRYLSIVSTMYLFDGDYSRSLANLCSAYGIEMEKHHNALSDARCCAEIFLRYLNEEEPDYNILPKKNKAPHTYNDSNMTVESMTINILREQNGEFFISNKSPQKNKTVRTFGDVDRVIESAAKKQDLSIVTNEDTIFYDKKVVISGIFEHYPVRNDLALLLKGYGADINGSISSKTNIFVVGKDSGPKKMEKVLELNNGGYNIQIIEETQLYKLLDEINHG